MTDRETVRVVTMTPYFVDGERYPSIIGVKVEGDEHETAYVKKSEVAAARGSLAKGSYQFQGISDLIEYTEE